MNSKITVIFLLSCVAFSKAGLVAVRTVEVLQGPGSRTSIVGPDGAHVESAAPGGTVVTDGSGAVPAAPVLLASGPAVVVGGGPFGSITTTYTAAGPAVVPAAVAPVAVAAVGLAGGNEGDYIPDNTEQLYDNGAYKGE